jgi:two-component system sensor histidine kinase QseC
MFYSMRRRILLALILALLVVMVTIAFVGYRVALHEADEIFSARLATSARVLETLLARQVEHATIDKPLVISLPAELSERNPDDPSSLGHPYETKLAFQVWSDQGHLLVRSQFAPEDRLGPLKEGFWERESDGTFWHVFTLKSDSVWIEVAEEVGLRLEIASAFGLILTTPLLVGCAILFLLVNLIVMLGLHPLLRLAHAIESRDPQDHSVITLNKTPEELLPVVKALNSFMTRMASVLERERRFNDSAAHELRTPLAAMRIHLENAASAQNEEDRSLSLAFLMTAMNRTQNLVEQMLTYGRISVDARDELELVMNLNNELSYLVDSHRALLDGTPISIDLEVPDNPVLIKARHGLLEILLRNLLDNACKYSHESNALVSVHLAINSMRTEAMIRFHNWSPPIPSEEVPRLFEPYYRSPSSQGKGGHGLGLAIALEIAKFHGWSIQLTRNSIEEGIEFTVVMLTA